MSRIVIPLGPFRGNITAIDKRFVSGNSPASSNIRRDDGKARPRYGFGNLRAAQGGFAAAYGFDYVQGYASASLVEEYISFENLGGGVNAYSRNASTLAPTAITGATGLNAGDWVSVPFEDFAYCINPAENIKKHAIGNTASWSSIGPPTAPATNLAYAVTYGGLNTPYSQLSWSGIDPTNASEMACTGGAANTGSVLNSDNTVTVKHTALGDASVEFDLSLAAANDQDWSYNDCFAFSLVTPSGSQFRVDASAIVVIFKNADGSPKTFTPDRVEVLSPNAWTHIIYLYFNSKVRADWDNVRKIKISYRTTAPALVPAMTVTVSKPWIGGVQLYDLWNAAVIPNYPSTVGLVLGYSYFNNTDGFESGVAGIISIPRSQISGYDPFGFYYYLGCHVQVTFTTSADAAVTHNRLYSLGIDSEWHQVVSQTDATTTYTYKITRVEADALPVLATRSFTATGCINAFAYRGSMAWLYKGGRIRFSRVGDPEMQADVEIDDPNDDQAGADYQLADNWADEALCGFDVGGAAVYLGRNATYAQGGALPVEMGPIFRLPGSYGVANKYAAARVKTEGGGYGVVFVSPTGGIYLVLVSDAFNPETGQRIIEIGENVKPSSRDWLLTPQSLTDWSTARVGYDENEDAVYVIVGARAMVLRRPSILDGKRDWEFYYWTMSGTGIKYIAFSPLRRMRWLQANGKVDENEWDTTNSTYYTGATRDGGAAMPASSVYIDSFMWTGPEARVHEVHREGDSYVDAMQVTVTSSRRSQTKTFTAGKKNLRFGPLQRGREHQVRFIFSDQYQPLSRAELMLEVSGTRRIRE